MNKIALATLFGFIIMLSACKKENDVTITETEEPVELGFKMAVNNTNLESDVYASYCQNDSMEITVISNLEGNLPFSIGDDGNLQFSLDMFAFEPGDFVYITVTEGNGVSWGFGGQAFGEDVTGGFPVVAILLSDSAIDIKSNDGSVVEGSAEGVLRYIDDENNLTEYPYAMEFAAEIIEGLGSCE